MQRVGRAGGILAAILALVLFALTLAASLTDGYVRVDRDHVQVRLYQEGLSAPGLIQIYVNCSGPGGEVTRATSETVELGWLHHDDLITVQSRLGHAGATLRYQLIVDGTSSRSARYSSPGEPGNQIGLGNRQTYRTWLETRTYRPSGSEVVRAGCRTGTHPALRITGPERSIGGPFYENGEWAFPLARGAVPVLVWLYYVAGILALLVAVGRRALRERTPDRTTLLLGFACVVILDSSNLISATQLPAVKVLFAAATAIASLIAAILWLRADATPSGAQHERELARRRSPAPGRASASVSGSSQRGRQGPKPPRKQPKRRRR
jgi:hypothetical protein